MTTGTSSHSLLPTGESLPRDGSLWGWATGDRVTSLIVAYSADDPPTFSVIPRVGEDPASWPWFADESQIGAWFWDDVRAGQIIGLGGAIAASPGVVFWADTHDWLGSDCCVVTSDLDARTTVLPHGVYTHWSLLRDGTPVPSAEVLLRDAPVTDLASRFRRDA